MILSLQKRMIVASCIATGLHTGFAQTQTTRSLTLKEAVTLCLDNNKQLKLNKVRIEAATVATKEIKDRGLPDISASASYLRVTKPKLGGALGNGPAPNVNQAAYTLVNASVPLFAGFKYRNGVDSYKYLEEAVKLDAEHDKEAIVQNTILAYSNLYKAQSNVNIVKENLKQAEQRTADFENLEKKGIVAKNDLLRIQLQQSKIQLTLLDAESNMRIATLHMNLMLGLGDSTQLVLDSTSFAGLGEAKSLTEYEQTAFTSRHDLEALKYREKSAFNGVKIAKSDYYPTLKLTGGYIAANIPNFVSISNAWNAGLGLNYSLSTLWKNGHKVQSAKMQLAEVKANEEILGDQVKVEVAQAHENYILSKKKIDVYTLALEQATENNRITKNKYRNNLVTTTDLLDADVQQLLAKLDFSNAQADAAVAYYKLLQITGTPNNQFK